MNYCIVILETPLFVSLPSPLPRTLSSSDTVRVEVVRSGVLNAIPLWSLNEMSQVYLASLLLQLFIGRSVEEGIQSNPAHLPPARPSVRPYTSWCSLGIAAFISSLDWVRKKIFIYIHLRCDERINICFRWIQNLIVIKRLEAEL